MSETPEEAAEIAALIERVKDQMRAEQGQAGQDAGGDISTSADMVIGMAIVAWLLPHIMQAQDEQGNQLHPLMYGLPLMVALALRAGASLAMDVDLQVKLGRVNELLRDNPKLFKVVSFSTLLEQNIRDGRRFLEQLMREEEDDG